MKTGMRTGKMLLAALSVTALLTACGSKEAEPEAKNVDLLAFYEDLATEYGWEDGFMGDVEGDLLDDYYPGLSDLTTNQLIAKAPEMSATVNELVFLECESETDANQASEILENRIETQAAGGAWYPESMEAWEEAQVLQVGTYVAMIASAGHQEEIAERFMELF